MWAILRANPLAFFLAVLLHLGVLAVLVFSLDWKTMTSPALKKVDVVQASVVDAQKIQQERDKLKAAEEAKKLKAKQERERKQETEKKKQLEAKRKKEKAQAQEKRRLEEVKKKKLTEKKRKADLAAKKKKAVETKKAVDAKRKKAAETKKKVEADRKKKVAAKKKADAERARKASEKALSDKLAAEETQRLVEHFVALITQKIQRNWRQPQNVPSGLASTLEVRLIPGGEVAGVRTIKSSGNATFDDSVEKAVLKASPLPLPKDPKEFNTFRVLNFVFKDKN